MVVPDATAVTHRHPPAKTGGAARRRRHRPQPPPPPPRRSTTPVKAEGWGTLKGQVVFGGDPPAAKVLAEKGKAAKDPEVCAKDAPIVSERLVVDGATKGVKNVLVYLPKPTGVNDEAKKAVSSAKIVFDQEKCVFEPHVLGMMAGTPITLKSSDPVNHNINAKLKNSPRSTSCSPAAVDDPVHAQGAERTPGRGDLRYPPLDEGLVDGPRPSLFRRDRRQGELRDQERPGRHPEGRRLAGGRRQERLRDRPSGDEVVIKANDATVKDFTIDAGRVRAE